VFAPGQRESEREREREREICKIKLEIILRVTCKSTSFSSKRRRKNPACLPHYLFASPLHFLGIAYLKKGEGDPA